MYNIVFLGAPGAGKGTQAVLVARKLKLVQIASGDLFRQAIEREDSLGKKVKAFLEAGKLVPDEITIELVLGRLSASGAEGGVILDGFPRNLKQASALDEALPKQGKAVDKAVYIKVAREQLIRRLSGRRVCRDCQVPYQSEHTVEGGECPACGGQLYRRPDDQPETVEKRLEVYFNKTAPLIDYYRQQGKLLEIDGEGSVEEVSRRIISALSKRESLAK